MVSDCCRSSSQERWWGGISVAVCAVLGPAHGEPRGILSTISRSNITSALASGLPISRRRIKPSHLSRHRSPAKAVQKYFDRLVPVGRLLWLGENLVDRLEHCQSVHF
jgi:hypothetical protein